MERDVAFFQIGLQWTIFPTALLLSALDIVQADFPLQLSWTVSDIHGKYPARSIRVEGNKLITSFKALRVKLKDDFYSFLSAWEPLMIGWIVKMEDDVGFQELYNLQVGEMNNILRNNKVTFNLNHLLPQDNSKTEVLLRIELLGLLKNFGFPILKVDHLLDKFKSYGVNENMPLDLKIISDVNAVSRRDICLNF